MVNQCSDSVSNGSRKEIEIVRVKKTIKENKIVKKKRSEKLGTGPEIGPASNIRNFL
ncbi:hypothetical protein LEP1GSC178_2533 [Leptospira licerasiae str. MMD4847]|uniref:Uncharacterized protein n=1 Tax=Leptospira licerasiae str. MMD4847 TaxID=1049971 RepID=A0ABN0HAR0_9LEPT|nr:hypothetical protein LEP1GSC178_2533 [Leptospira licerasiae str. MMD4847]